MVFDKSKQNARKILIKGFQGITLETLINKVYYYENLSEIFNLSQELVSLNNTLGYLFIEQSIHHENLSELELVKEQTKKLAEKNIRLGSFYCANIKKLRKNLSYEKLDDLVDVLSKYSGETESKPFAMITELPNFCSSVQAIVPEKQAEFIIDNSIQVLANPSVNLQWLFKQIPVLINLLGPDKYISLAENMLYFANLNVDLPDYIVASQNLNSKLSPENFEIVNDFLKKIYTKSERLGKTLITNISTNVNKLLDSITEEEVSQVYLTLNEAAKINHIFGFALYARCQKIIDKYNVKGVEDFFNEIKIIAADDHDIAVSLMDFRLHNLELYDLMLKCRMHDKRMYHLASELLKNEEVSLKLGNKGRVKMITAALDRYNDDMLGALHLLKTDSDSFADYLKTNNSSVLLDDAGPILSKYLVALLGNPLEIVEGEKAHTDGEKVYLQKSATEFDSKDENFSFYKVLATQMEAQVEFGSFDFEIKKVQSLVNQIKKRYKNARA